MVRPRNTPVVPTLVAEPRGFRGENMAHSFDVVPVWNGLASTLDAYEERVKRYVQSTKKDDRYLCGPRLLQRFHPEGDDAYRPVVEHVNDADLMTDDGSALIVKARRKTFGPRSMQEVVSAFKELIQLHVLRRQSEESMRAWTTRWKLHMKKVGHALHQACSDIDAEKFLHPVIRCILLSETCGLTAQEFASVLSISGKPVVGKAIGNSWDEDVVQALISQWSESAVVARDRAMKRNRAHAHALEDFSSWHSELDEIADAAQDDDLYYDEGAHGVGPDEEYDEEYGHEDDEEEYDADEYDQYQDEASYQEAMAAIEEQFGPLEEAEQASQEIFASASRS